MFSLYVHLQLRNARSVLIHGTNLKLLPCFLISVHNAFHVSNKQFRIEQFRNQLPMNLTLQTFHVSAQFPFTTVKMELDYYLQKMD